MLRSILIWLKYWLILPGCTSFFPRSTLRHLVVLSFGRQFWPDSQLHQIRALYNQNRQRPIRLITSLRLGLDGCPTIHPGFINMELAEQAMTIYDRSGSNLILWLPWDVAMAFPEMWLYAHWDQIRIIWPSDRPGTSLNENDVLSYVFGHLDHPSSDIPHTGLLAHQGVIIRAMLTWRKLSGALPIIPPQHIDGHFRQASQPQAQSTIQQFFHELMTRSRLAVKGLI